ncbi:MAG: hypothetical protein ABI895_34700 [Deltaproteobacteria bacterium]
MLVALECAWLRLDDRAILIPHGRMKARVDFALPLSKHMVALVRRALKVAEEVLHPGAKYLFPTRAHGGAVIATQVWKEKGLPNETGHSFGTCTATPATWPACRA